MTSSFKIPLSLINFFKCNHWRSLASNYYNDTKFMKKLLSCLLILSAFGTQAQLDVQIKLGDRSACTNSTLLLIDSIVTGTPISYEWISSIATFSSTSSSITQASVTASGEVILKTQDATSTFYDTVYVTLNNPPVVTVGNNQSVCCDYGNINLNFSINTPSGTPSSGVWNCPANPSLVASNVFSSVTACGLISVPSAAIASNLMYTYQDPATQCFNRDSLTITVNALPGIVLAERTYCQDLCSIRLDDLVISPANTAIGTVSWRCLDSNSIDNKFVQDMLENRSPTFPPDLWLDFCESSYTIQNANQDTIVLEFSYTNAKGCRNLDTVNFIVARVPNITFSSQRDLCWDEGNVSLKDLMDVNLNDGNWSVVDTSSGVRYRDPADLGGISGGDTINTLLSTPLVSSLATPNSWRIRYIHTASRCPTFKDTFLIINPLPRLRLDPLFLSYCESSSDIFLRATPSGATGIWTSTDSISIVGSNTFSPSSATIKGADITLFYNYTNPATGCFNVDSIFTRIDATPILNIEAEDSFCYLNTGVPISSNFTVTAENSVSLSWFVANTFNNAKRVTAGDIYLGDITFVPERDRDTFRIIVAAGGENSCPDYTDFFDVIFYQDPSCMLSTPDLDETQIAIYPNPSNGSFTISNAKKYTVRIYDIFGKQVNYVSNSKGQITSLQKGIYVIELIEEYTASRITKKLVVK